jgi:hypothetical protein
MPVLYQISVSILVVALVLMPSGIQVLRDPRAP